MKRIIPLLLFFLLLLTSLSWAEVSERQRNGLSEQMMNDITRAYGKTRDLDVNEPLAQVFRNLVAQTKRKNINYRMRIAQNDKINAYALPDGRVVFLSGLIHHLPGDDMTPLAWVAAHEIAHIEMRHGEKKFTRSLTTGILLAVLTGGSSEWVQALAGVSQGILTSGYSRVQEYEADREALVLMRQAGYDPQGSLVTLRLFEDLDKKRGGLRIFPTHPKPADRMKSVMAWMDKNGIAVAGQGQDNSSAQSDQQGRGQGSNASQGTALGSSAPQPSGVRGNDRPSVEFPQDSPPPLP
jgi:predicted Zn-dependent protease